MLPSSHQNNAHSSDEKIGIFNNNPATPPADSIGNIFNIGLARDMHLVELRNIQALIAHKQQELNVYTSARQLIETRDAGEPCLVFLADNVFVLRSREQALPILDRQCGHFQRALQCLEQEQKAMEEKVQLMDRLHVTDEGLVDIREPIKEGEGLAMGQKGKRRIAHTPKWEKKPAADVNKQQHWQASTEQPTGTIKAMAGVQVKSDESGPIHPLKSLEKEIGKVGEKKQREIPPRPKGVPEADYKKFLALVNSLELSEDDDEEDEQEEEEEKHEDLVARDEEESTEMEEPRDDDDDDERMEEDDEENGGDSGENEEDDEDLESKNQQAGHSVAGTSGNRKKRRVRFLPSLVQLDDDGQPTDGQSKSILKNKNEHSPIDAAEVNKIDRRDRRQVWPASKETVKDNVLEQAAKPSRQLRSTPNKRQKQKNRPVSQWKARRMGLPTESDEENDNNP